ncbi:PH domain-containing protein [Dactylosporangium roseum]|uniref:PH domain-containing protein n=1 Tax=Dactylosporangium roseum TaxID=47989 RepID=A0ABY5Z2D0_9ACTN|nr:PH domain-containing protein [Dactylosporangium roseum]UWZ36160.1 PH domain-containing protein [Dactylosporangium roseum]
MSERSVDEGPANANESPVKGIARKVVAIEGNMWRSLALWILRRPTHGPGGAAFGYIKPLNAVLWAFIIVSAVETVAFHLILPWPVVRLAVDLLSVYGLVWMFGILAAYKVHLHVVDDRGIRLRHGFFIDVLIPWADIAAVRPGRKFLAGSGTVQVEHDTVHIVVSGQTNMEIELRRPVAVSLKKVDGPVRRVRFYADDPEALAQAASRA